MLKKKLTLFMLLLVVTAIIAACGNGGDSEQASGEPKMPSGTINGVIQWGSGGSTDTLSRGIANLAEDHLEGASIVVTNMTGATGAIATEHVYNQPSDGQTLLFAAENPTIYGVLDISERSFEDFYPINIMGRAVPVIVVPTNSVFETVEDLFQFAEENPGNLSMGSTGPGGVPHVISSMISAEKDLIFNMVPFDGDGPALTALLGGHIDFSVAVLSAVSEYERSGDVRILAAVNNEPLEEIPNVPALGDIYPEFNQYLPWGPFFGVWVKQDTPDAVKEHLVDAFDKAHQDQEYQDLLASLGAIPMGIHGDEAVEFWKQWQSVTAWILQDSGEATVSPEELNIPRVGE
ncbi:Bug family tripartite tricarboxylate transporter substrate binding protein [Bacillus horti]|uniref:Tripartite-type tricarboxylate transporter receptor subunit TctC n=1 Tax=Caldalkalibacillus horti TaxID=77523 RepID=A0ABT9W152_9BACI|nr:tripartite tricarboxylate transporter substrate binding protein [Bacillus horti]MDQ0166988.1 tripartite-type tricarboxylate transporter receptor subunit TctC [Bacillus horti]